MGCVRVRGGRETFETGSPSPRYPKPSTVAKVVENISKHDRNTFNEHWISRTDAPRRVADFESIEEYYTWDVQELIDVHQGTKFLQFQNVSILSIVSWFGDD
jgi:hypothetical protein